MAAPTSGVTSPATVLQSASQMPGGPGGPNFSDAPKSFSGESTLTPAGKPSMSEAQQTAQSLGASSISSLSSANTSASMQQGSQPEPAVKMKDDPVKLPPGATLLTLPGGMKVISYGRMPFDWGLGM